MYSFSLIVAKIQNYIRMPKLIREEATKCKRWDPDLHFTEVQWNTFQFRDKVGAYSM